MNNDEWRPNWLDGAKYPGAAKTSLEQWTWEFLRRNPEYQKLWREIVLPYYDAASGAIDSVAAMADARKRAYQDPEFQKFRAAGEGSYTISNPLNIFREKFGVMSYPPPPHANNQRLVIEHRWIVSVDRPSLEALPADRPYNVTLSLEPGESYVRFDLSLPIQPQIERVRKWLEGTAAWLHGQGDIDLIRKTNHVEKYPTYLRALDAEASGATLREMAEVLFPDAPNDFPDRKGEQSVRNALRAAMKLRDGGYRYIGL